MSLEGAFESLRREFTRLQEAVSALHVTVTEDKPARGAAVLVDRLDNLVTDLSGTLEEADARAAHAVQGSGLNGPLDAVRIALRRIHELLNGFTALYTGDLASHDRISRLLEMGRERGREWREWSQEVKTAIERCAPPMKAAAAAILECWSELAERLARNSVSVQATNIGQQITLREDQLELAGEAT
ncbi:MAG: hypothetical protein ACKV2U_04805 [Bryobacteraceae bacterium]